MQKKRKINWYIAKKSLRLYANSIVYRCVDTLRCDYRLGIKAKK